MTKERILEICDEIAALKERFGFADGSWSCIENELGKIRTRCRDPALYLGVVGEFSCGKSTFINALLGLDLLKEDILQGTTCAPTFVRKGESFEIIIHGERDIHISKEIDFAGLDVAACVDHARDVVHRYTANEVFAAQLKSVEILLPIENGIFDNGVVLVDTPGINADNPRHQRVAEETVQVTCDTVLVLTPSNIPCSQTLISFVRDKIGGMSSRCVGIATCLDRLRPRERMGTVKYIRSRFESEGCALADVKGVAALFAAHPERDSACEDADDFRRAFSLTIREIVDKTVTDRISIVISKLKELITGLVETRINELLDRTVEDLSARKIRLAQNGLRDMDVFLDARRRKYCEQVGRRAPTPSQIRETVDTVCDIQRDAYNYRLYAARDLATLKARTTSESVTSMLESCRNQAVDKVAQFAKDMLQWAQSAMQELNDEFNAEFRSLGGSSGRIVDQHVQSADLSVDISNACRDDLVDAIVPQGAVKVGGAIVGVVVGSILLPGVGTILGGIAGNFLGGLFGKSLDERKRDAESAVRDIVNGWKPTLIEKLTEYACTASPTDIRNRINVCIDQYALVKPEVEKVIDAEKGQMRGLETLIEKVHAVKRHFTDVLEEEDSGGGLS